jgi:hypothetical protein
MRTISWVAVLLLAALLASESALGQEQEFAFRASVTATYSDNPARTATGESATALDGLVGLRIAHQSALLFADADVSELQRAYVEGHLPSETIPNGYLNLLAGPAGGLFTWTVKDNFGQISSEPFAALVAGDRQNVNILSTGPNLRIPLDSHDHLDLTARYGRDTFSDSTLDDQNYKGQAQLLHDISPASQLGLVYSYQRVEFREASLANADLTETYAKYALAGARTYIVLEAGLDTLEQAPAPRANTYHVLALLQRHLTERLTFEGAYRHGDTDAASAFVSASRDGFTAGTDQTVQARAAPFVGSEGYAQLTRSAGRLLLAVEVTGSQETFPSAPASDRHTWGANVSSDYQLSSKLTLRVWGGYFGDYFPDGGFRGRWSEGSIGLTRQLGSALQVSLRVSRAKGTGNALLSPFTENRGVLQLVYAPGEERLRRIYDTNAPFRYYDRPVQPIQPMQPVPPQAH